jgi:hypothetical protein
MANIKVLVTYDPKLHRDCLDAYTLALTHTDAEVTNRLDRAPSASQSVRTRVGVFGSYDAAARAVFSYIDAPCGLVCDTELRWFSTQDGAVRQTTYRLVGIGRSSSILNGMSREVILGRGDIG